MLEDSEMTVLYLEQSDHKNYIDDRIPDKKIIVRREDIHLCPMSSLAIMLFDRFILNKEKEFNIVGEEYDVFWNVFLFRSNTSSTTPVNKNSLYKQRKDMMNLTDTGLGSCVNHSDRRIGAWLAILQGLTLEQVKSVGLWNSEQVDRHYVKYLPPDVVAKLAGFSTLSEYYISRSKLSIETFLNGRSATDKHFFEGFMPFLFDAHLEKQARKLMKQGIKAPVNVLQALRHLHLVFFQDLGAYYEYNPNLRMFNCPFFKNNQKIFEDWLKYSNDTMAEADLQSTASYPVSNAPASREIESRITHLHNEMKNTKGAVDRILYLMESKEQGSKDAVPKLKIESNRLTHPTHIALRPLKEMNFKQVIEEWILGYKSNGLRHPPLREFDEARVSRKIKYDHSLKTTLLQRRRFFDFFRYNCVVFGNEDVAYKRINDLQLSLSKNKELCSLNCLWKYLKKNRQWKQ
eukprot:g5156.t1